jgi:cephalosporin-C deacetylase-like acetyl esterase
MTWLSFVGCALAQYALQTSPLLDQTNNMRHYLMRVATEITDHPYGGMDSLADWQAIRPQREQEFLEMMGLYDVPWQGQRPPLNVKIVDTIHQDGFRIEKLYYESLPDLYVPANLYIPNGIKKPVPAILYVCGHAETQKVYYQAHARKFAQLGFVCLIIETIQWGEVRGQHWGCYANGWFHWYSRGYTPAGVELWNGIRGLDLLCARTEVNPEKLGVTGISGGGAQSWYIAAADQRIKAVATACGASTLKAHLQTKTIDNHCDCMTPINTYQRDFHDIGALIAPRPLLMVQSNRDGLNTIESVRDLHQTIKRLYDWHGASPNLQLVETPGGHSYHKNSRQAIFAFFMKHLQKKEMPVSEIGDIDESEQAQWSQDRLRVYVHGPLPKDRTLTIQDTFFKLPAPPTLSSREQVEAQKKKTVQFLKTRTFAAFPKEPAPFAAACEFRSDDGAPYGLCVYSFISEPGWRLRTTIRWHHPQRDKHAMMIVLRDPDEMRGATEKFIAELNKDWNVAIFDCRGVGDTGWAADQQWHLRRASAWTGRTLASMRVYDLVRCIEFIKTLDGVDKDKIALAGQGEMSVIALYAALLNGHCCGLLLQDPPATQNAASRPDGRGEAIEMLNCLRVTDVNQIPGLLLPTPIAFVGKWPKEYTWSQQVYQVLGHSEQFRTIAGVGDF